MTTPSKVWGLWATLIWALLIAGVFIGVQALVTGAYVYFTSVGLTAAEKHLRYEQAIRDGDLLALATIASGVIGVLLTVAVTAIKTGPRIRGYLGLSAVTAGQLLKWCLGFVVLLIALELLTAFLDYSAAPDFMTEIYASTNSKLLLFFAVVVVASVFEELFFRGFLLEGFRRTFIGATGSVILTAVLWSLVHVQYDVFGMVSIFLIGLFFGVAKLRTGSTSLTMVLHGLNNALAFIFLVYTTQV